MKTKNILIRTNPIFKKCPDCNESNSLHKSKFRNLKERIVKTFTFMDIYRCSICGWRGYLSSFSFTKKSFKNLIFYILIGIVTALLVFGIMQIIV